MPSLKPITLYAHASGPNPWKVAMIMEELGVPYEKKWINLRNGEAQSEPYVSINPNGRVPAIEDPNTGLVLFESGAIIEYLVSEYDGGRKISYGDDAFAEKWHLKQYLHLQMSGQGPYFGQAVWFRVLHPEDVPSAKKRYDEQVMRLWGVLDSVLKDREYLVGDKCTYADIAFVPWNQAMKFVYQAEWESLEIDKKYPNFLAWHERVTSRPAIQKVLKDKEAAAAAEAK